MDVKISFLKSEIEEEVYVMQPPGFEDPKNQEMVYMLHMVLYGLKQAPRAWYDTLPRFPAKEEFQTWNN